MIMHGGTAEAVTKFSAFGAAAFILAVLMSMSVSCFDGMSSDLQDGKVTVVITPQQLQPSRRQVQQHLPWPSTQAVAGPACSDAQPAQEQARAGGAGPDCTQQCVVCSGPAATSSACSIPTLHDVPPQQQPPASTGLSGAVAATASPLRKAASLPVSLPEEVGWMSSLHAAATAGVQQQPAAATATAAALSDGQTKQPLPVVSAAAEQGAQMVAGRPSDVLHALACGGLACSMPPVDADAAAAGTRATGAQHSTHPASPPAASAGSQSCAVCRRHGLDDEAAWHHFKVMARWPASAGPNRLTWCYRCMSCPVVKAIAHAYKPAAMHQLVHSTYGRLGPAVNCLRNRSGL